MHSDVNSSVQANEYQRIDHIMDSFTPQLIHRKQVKV